MVIFLMDLVYTIYIHFYHSKVMTFVNLGTLQCIIYSHIATFTSESCDKNCITYKELG